MLDSCDVSNLQSPNEGVEGTHLPQAAEVEVPEMLQSEDAEAEITASGGVCDCFTFFAAIAGFGCRDFCNRVGI